MPTIFFSAEELTNLRQRLTPLLQGPPYNNQHKYRPASPEQRLWEMRNELANVLQALETAETDEERKQIQTKIQQLRRNLRVLMLRRRHKDSDLAIETLANQGEPVGDGWTSCRIDQTAIFNTVSGLSLKSDWQLHAYAYRIQGNGNGVVWALPKTAPEPPILYEENTSLSNPPCPSFACSFAEALEGDSSHVSYMQASLLIREITEFAALWHGISWGTHEIVSLLPEWAFNAGKAHSDLRPKVEIKVDGKVIVTFYTTCSLGTVRLIQHRDQYHLRSYKPIEMLSHTIATGGLGYVH